MVLAGVVGSAVAARAARPPRRGAGVPARRGGRRRRGLRVPRAGARARRRSPSIPLGVVLLGSLPVILELTERRSRASAATALIWLAGQRGRDRRGRARAGHAGPSRPRLSRCLRRPPRSCWRSPEGSGRARREHRPHERDGQQHRAARLRGGAARRPGPARGDPPQPGARDRARRRARSSSSSEALETAPTACAPSSRPAAALIDSARADAIELRAALEAARGTRRSCAWSSPAPAPSPTSAARPSSKLAQRRPLPPPQGHRRAQAATLLKQPGTSHLRGQAPSWRLFPQAEALHASVDEQRRAGGRRSAVAR